METTTIGHNIWKKAGNKDINKGKIVSLNMQGWGAMIERRLLWNQLTYMKAMIVVLIDHRRTQTQLKGIEAEARINWIGEQTKWKARWQHVPTHNSKVGGISIGIHPIISRYVIKDTTGQDHRKWGRWTCTHIGGKNKIAIIGTYGPTKNEGEKENASMWRTQERKMQTIPREERKRDPKEQYIADIQKAITELKHKEYQVIILGDSNINEKDKGNKYTIEWKKQMQENKMHNIHKLFWPTIQHKIHTWELNGTQTWIDQIYVSRETITQGAIEEAGIETGHTSYTSDHHMIGMTVNFNKIIGKLRRLPIQQQVRHRVVKAGNKEIKQIYKLIAEEREKEQIEKQKLTMTSRIDQLYKKAKQLGRQGTEKQKGELKHNMNETMKAVVEELLAIENRQYTESNQSKQKTYKGGNKKRHLRSEVMGKKTKIHKILIALLKQSRQKNKRRQSQREKRRSTFAFCREKVP